jgi:hypothetical protein
MKIKTDLRAGNLIEDTYGYVSDALASIPPFIREADAKADMLYRQAVDATQALWGKLTSILD